MWSAGGGDPAGGNRGFPARGVFYLNRLALGRSKALKNIVALSTAGVFDNFDDSTNDAVASFSASFNGKGNQTIQDIIADDSLIFTTTNKCFAQNPLVESPLSVSNFYFAPQSQDPASNIPAVTIDNQILHVSGNYSQVMRLTYSTADAKYKAIPVGLLSSHLFKTLNSNASWDPANIEARLYIATQTDGSMLFYNSLQDENITCWTHRSTRGQFRQVIGEGNQAHVIVEREINVGATYTNTADGVFLTNTLFTAFDDVTTSVAAALTTVTIFSEQDEYLLLANLIPFTGFDLTFDTVASADIEAIFEYLDANGNWNTFDVTDGSVGFTQNGAITWAFDDVLDWAPGDVGTLESYYFIRIRRTVAELVTAPINLTLKLNTATRLFLEQLDFNTYTDCTVTKTSSNTGAVTGLGALAGHQVYAIEGDASYGPFFVESDGTTNIGFESSSVKIGIQYKPLLVPMPLQTPTQEGDNTYAKKHVQDLYIDYVDSLYLQVGTDDGLTDVPALPLGNYTLGQSVPPATDVFTLSPRGDWEPRQEFKITQSMPGPMTIIGVGYHVEIT
jgi:hypothetical protein